MTMADPVSSFDVRPGGLCCDGVALDAIADALDTPVHVYSAAALRARYRAFDAAFAGYPHRLHYAVKANATLGVVRVLRDLGAAADANSAGEMEVALRAGCAPGDIVCTGVGKRRDELARAVALGVLAVNAESAGEVERLDALARAEGVRARVAVRVNPDVDAGTLPQISTGLSVTKFGMPAAEVRAVASDIARRPHLALVGLHVHVGSQLTRVEPVARAAAAVADLARVLERDGMALEHLDVGGGLGIAYEPGQAVLSVDAYAAAVLAAVRPTGLRLLLEPGRWIVGPAGVLLTRVVDRKPQVGGREFVVVDAGMTDLLRPALYGAWHAIEPVAPRPGVRRRVDVVGPVCETTDTLGADRELPPLEVGDLLAIRDTGAYGAVMASNYNRRPIAPEVLVENGQWRVVRRRQSVDEMLQWDV
jgi:diaminopimelate decarboxylase